MTTIIMIIILMVSRSDALNCKTSKSFFPHSSDLTRLHSDVTVSSLRAAFYKAVLKLTSGSRPLKAPSGDMASKDFKSVRRV